MCTLTWIFIQLPEELVYRLQMVEKSMSKASSSLCYFGGNVHMSHVVNTVHCLLCKQIN